MYSRVSGDPLLMLLTLTFPDTSVYRYVNNTEDITSNGVVYTAFPFEFTLPNDTDNEVPELEITISNVGLELIESLSVNTEMIKADIVIVFASIPDFVELPVHDMELKLITYDQKFISMTLGFDDILNIKIPSQTYSAIDYPGLLSV
jgi:hypothetical protein